MSSFDVLQTATLENVESVLLSKDFKLFVAEAWNHIEPAPLVWNWHMGAICDHYQAVSEGKITNLLVNVPPGTSKSLITSVFWPAWGWTWNPKTRWFFASYDLALSLRDSMKCRNLITSKWYRDRWGHAFEITGDQDAKQLYYTSKGGYRLATSIGGHGTGEHPHRIVVDDPQDRKKADSPQERKNVKDWWELTMSTRGVSLKASRTVVMQRLHEDDLSGVILADTEGWDVLCLPMRYEPGRMKPTSLGFEDPRSRKGELLAPVQFPEDEVKKLEKALKAYGTAGQLQQRPAPEAGGIFKRKHWRFWKPKGSDLPIVRDAEGNEFVPREKPERFDEQLISMDCSFKKETDAIRKGNDPDAVSCGAWGRSGPDCFLLDRKNDRMDVMETADTLEAFAKRYPLATKKLVEDKANGPAVMQLLRHRVPGLIPVTPKGSKIVRATTAASSDDEKDARTLSCQGLVEAGNVYLPHPAIAPWVWDYIEQFANFPNVSEDDDVDMTSQALARLQLGVWKHEGEERDAAEKSAAMPKDLYELRKQQMEAQLAKYEKPQEDDVVPPRYRYL